MTWQATKTHCWQGRDDRAESPNAKRLFQTIQVQSTLSTLANVAQVQRGNIALLGFACDEGVRRNQGRPGAKSAPDAIRKALASLAAHNSAKNATTWWDVGNVVCNNNDLEAAQQQFAELVSVYQQCGATTLALGGGHETAFAHGLGIYQTHVDKTIGIINFDAHLDMRTASQATSGTPFLQLAQYCQTTGRDFHYLCIGASRAANTTALIDNAKQYGTQIIWDTDCFDTPSVIQHIKTFINHVDAVYLSIDLDVLPASQMFAVSAPAALGIPLFEVMQWLNTVSDSGKLIAGDVVEYNPSLDRDQLCARVAARLIWQLGDNITTSNISPPLTHKF